MADGGYEDRLWSDGRFVYIGTLKKFGHLPIQVEVFHSPPPPPPPDGQWQHVAEVSLVANGHVELFNWPGDDPVLVIPVEDGPTRLRVAWQGLVAGLFEGMDDEGNSDERISLTLWNEATSAPRVTRRWRHWH